MQSRCNPAAMAAAILGRGRHEEAKVHAGGSMRARYPDADGYVERDGVKVFYEVFGSGQPTVLLLPAWSIVYSRIWKLQVPYLARHYRVVTFDGTRVFVNEAYCRMFGKSREELIGTSFMPLVHERDREFHDGQLFQRHGRRRSGQCRRLPFPACEPDL